MSVRYVILPKKDPRNLTAPEKYYLVSKSFAAIDRDFLIKDMVTNTSLTAMEATTGIDYLFQAIPKYLSLGFTVQLGKLGYFMVTLRSEGSDTADEAVVGKIKQKKLRFVCGKDIRKTVNEFYAEKYNSKEK